jgi:hypothetical protein
MDETYDAVNMAESLLGAILQVFLLVIGHHVPAFHEILQDVLDPAQMLFRVFPIHVTSIEKPLTQNQGLSRPTMAGSPSRHQAGRY